MFTFEPTPYSDLNAVLAHLLAGARRLLGDNFVGLYLQGSFAVGDASELSDCDFLIVTERDITLDEIPAFQAFHESIHELPNRWRNEIEGSYIPAPILRRWSTEPRDPPGEPRGEGWADPGTLGSPPLGYPLWYLDHGAKTLVRSEHDNTQVVRWCLREKGVALAGPDPRDLIDPVTPDMLRAEIRPVMLRYRELGLETMPMVAWQVFWVGLYCRMLHTLETGAVWSKSDSLRWGMETLDPAWRPLLAHARATKKGAPESWGEVSPEAAAATRAFADYAIRWAGLESP